jgi:hypothetical protein
MLSAKNAQLSRWLEPLQPKIGPPLKVSANNQQSQLRSAEAPGDLSLLPAAQRHCQTDNGGHNAADEHPDSLVRRRTGEKPGNVRAEGVGGVDANDHKNDPADKQGQRDNSIHNGLSNGVFNLSQR